MDDGCSINKELTGTCGIELLLVRLYSRS